MSDVDDIDFPILRGVRFDGLFQVVLKFLWKDDYIFVVVVITYCLRIHLQLLAEYLAAGKAETRNLIGLLEVQVWLFRM